MKQFQFRLQRVLELREGIEEREKINLGRAVSTLNLIQVNINTNRQKYEVASQERFRDANNIDTIRMYDSYISGLEYQKEMLLAQKETAEKVVAEARQKYIKANQDKKVVEKLKDKKLAEYKKYVNRENTRLLDDMKRERQAV
ncbi:MAG: flagellar export protein FliJ [Spirochaetaceae bacterium]|nr:flagellar export protein FliJ [Spirochaetaceae bacterium]